MTFFWPNCNSNHPDEGINFFCNPTTKWWINRPHQMLALGWPCPRGLGAQDPYLFRERFDTAPSLLEIGKHSWLIVTCLEVLFYSVFMKIQFHEFVCCSAVLCLNTLCLHCNVCVCRTVISHSPKMKLFVSDTDVLEFAMSAFWSPFD